MPVRLGTLRLRTFIQIKDILWALPKSIRNNLQFVMITGIINAALEVSSVLLLSIFIEKATLNETLSSSTQDSQLGIYYKLYSLSLNELGLFAMGITLSLAIVRFLNIKSTAVASQAVSSELSRFFVGSVLRSEFKKVQTINQSEFVALAVSKNLSFVKYIIFPLIQLTVSLFVVIAFLLLLLQFSSSSELFALFLLALLFTGATIYTRKKVAYSSLKISESFDKIVKILNRIINGFREIRVAQKSEFIRQQFVDADSDLLNAEITTRIYTLSPKVIIEAIVVIFVILFICFKSPENGSISISSLITILLITQRTLPHIQNISFGISSMRAGRSILNDIHKEVICNSLQSPCQGSEEPKSIEPKTRSLSLDMEATKEPILQFVDVSFKYTESSINSVVKDLSFELRQGDCLALLGKSGSGKTTVLDLASGLLPPTNGTVHLDDFICKVSSNSQIAYVTQKPFIIDGTIEENIKLFSNPNQSISNAELIKICEKADLFSPTSNFKLNSLLTENGSNLSGGQLTRLSIARALISDPSLLLLDEPTSSLDPKTELNVIQSLKNLLSSKICIIATHRPKPLELCNRFLLLADGNPTFLSKHDSQKFLSSNSFR